MRTLRTLLLLPALVLLAACAAGDAAVEPEPIAGAVPFADGERLTYAIEEDDGTPVGRGVFEAMIDGDTLRLVQRFEEANPPEGVQPTSDETRLVVDGETFAPRSGERDLVRRMGGTASTEHYEWRYEADEDGARVVVEETRGDTSNERSARLRAVHYDNESSLWLWRTLPLVDDYTAQYVAVQATGNDVQTVTLTVADPQTIEVPAGTFETWPLQARAGRATTVAWIEVDPPHRVVQWDNGVYIFKLEASE